MLAGNTTATTELLGGNAGASSGVRAQVSVVVPCFRCSLSIDRAVESIAKQTLLPREVILIDDASDDDTPEVLRALQARYESGWIRLLRLEKNSGQSIARNAGWDAAYCEYIAFLDADDSWHPRKIELQYGWMTQNPRSVLTGQVARHVVEAPSGALGANDPPSLAVHKVDFSKLLLSNRFSTPSVMLRRSVGYRFDERKRYSEDYLLWLKLTRVFDESYEILTPLVYVHKRHYGEGGLSSNLWKMQLSELAIYRSFYKDNDMSALSMIVVSAISTLKFVKRVFLSAFFAWR